MTDFEHQLIHFIRESADPAKTIEMVTDMMQRLITGEDPKSIAEHYGITLKEENSQ